MEWSNAKTLEFLDLYENEPAVWNPSHPKHKDRNAVNNAWKRIEAKSDVPLKELKKKKDALLATYRKLSKKAQISMRSGASPDDYKPAWFAYDIMERFLHGIYTPRKFRNLENAVGEGDSDTDSTIQTCADNALEPAVIIHTLQSDTSTDSFIEASLNEPITHSHDGQVSDTSQNAQMVPNRIPAKRRKGIVEDDSTNVATSKIFKHSICNAIQTQDPCSTYGQHVANKLRSYTSKTRAYVEHLINNVLFEADMGKFDNIHGILNRSSHSSVHGCPVLGSLDITTSCAPNQPFPMIKLKREDGPL